MPKNNLIKDNYGSKSIRLSQSKNMQQEITFDREELKKLKAVYKRAVTENREIFKFRGVDLLTSYAKYLIEYLDSRLK